MVCNCCEDCECPIDLPDWDDIKQLFREWKDEYSLINILVLSRCHQRCVSQRRAHFITFLIVLFEIACYVLMALQLSDLVNTMPNFDRKISKFSSYEWSDDCNKNGYTLSYIKEAKYWSSVLLPVHATLLGLGSFFCCCLCQPPWGPLIGGVLRIPLSIVMIVYLWLLYDAFNYVLNNNCIIVEASDDRYINYFGIERVVEWCLLESIYATLILSFMFPTICLIYFLFYYSMKNLKNCIYHFFERLYFPCVTRHCHNIYFCFVLLTCCLSENARNNYLGNDRRRRGANDKSNLSPEERKKLVKFSNGNCPICGDENKELILTQGCNHGCCVDCLTQYINVDLKDISKYPRQCFYPDCHTLIQYTNVEYVLSENQQDLMEYDRMLIKSADNGADTISCPVCKSVMVKPRLLNEDERSLMHCVNSNCKTALCARCDCAWHHNITCAEYKEKMDSNKEDLEEAFSSLMKQEKWCRCPKCGIVVERTEGCNHMTHQGCPKAEKDNRSDFCYICAEPLEKTYEQGWRFSAITHLKHFENGVFEPCINADKQKNNDPDAALGRIELN